MPTSTRANAEWLTPRTFRIVVRWGHLLSAASVSLLLYSPLGTVPAYADVVRWVLFPISAALGIALWQQKHVLRWLGSGR